MPLTEAIVPRLPVLDVRRFEQAIQAALNDAEREALVSYGNTVQTWTRKPVFTSQRLALWERVIGTDDEIYGYVNHGTEPHIIRPRNPGGVLAFQSGYQAKTIPNVAFSRAGGAFGPTVHAREVNHPGTEARNFDDAIANRVQSRIVSLFNLGMRNAIR